MPCIDLSGAAGCAPECGLMLVRYSSPPRFECRELGCPPHAALGLFAFRLLSVPRPTCIIPRSPWGGCLPWCTKKKMCTPQFAHTACLSPCEPCLGAFFSHLFHDPLRQAAKIPHPTKRMGCPTSIANLQTTYCWILCIGRGCYLAYGWLSSVSSVEFEFVRHLQEPVHARG